jgi:hypothetical protein
MLLADLTQSIAVLLIVLAAVGYLFVYFRRSKGCGRGCNMFTAKTDWPVEKNRPSDKPGEVDKHDDEMHNPSHK